MWASLFPTSRELAVGLNRIQDAKQPAVLGFISSHPVISYYEYVIGSRLWQDGSLIKRGEQNVCTTKSWRTQDVVTTLCLAPGLPPRSGLHVAGTSRAYGLDCCYKLAIKSNGVV